MMRNPTSPEESSDRQPSERAELVERLFQEHNDSLLRFLSTRLRSYQEAREVAQEAYVRLLMLDSPGAVSYLRAFLFKIAANLAVDRMRSRRSEERHTTFTFFETRTPAASAEQVVAGLEDCALLQRLLEELPLKCRRAFMLNRFHGLGIAEIAKDLHTTERSVRRYIVQAMVHCRAGLDAAHGVVREELK
jgi:RNA polymerase sigma factor (sigma-70 family)